MRASTFAILLKIPASGGLGPHPKHPQSVIFISGAAFLMIFGGFGPESHEKASVLYFVNSPKRASTFFASLGMSLALPAAEPETFRRCNESRRRKTIVCRGRNVLCRTGLVARPLRSILLVVGPGRVLL
jgi:hypothetical protein